MKDMDLDPKEKEVLEAVRSIGQATSGQLAKTVKNRHLLNFYLWKLYWKNLVEFKVFANMKVWEPNGYTHGLPHFRPIISNKIDIEEDGKITRRVWVDLFDSKSYGNYIFISERRKQDQNFKTVGSIIVPKEQFAIFAVTLLKSIMKSEWFRKSEDHEELLESLKVLIDRGRGGVEHKSKNR